MSRSFGGVFDVEKKQSRLVEIELLEAQESFWADPKLARQITKEKSALSLQLQKNSSVGGQLEDTVALIELVEADPSVENLNELNSEFTKLFSAVRAMEMQLMLGGSNDMADAIVCINAGAGGTEAQDWAEMLLRMYLRYCEQQGYKTQIVDQQVGEEAGIKSTTFLVQGQYSYGHLKAEIGVHRLVRVSPFDSNARRHTSFASVFVYPDIDEDIEIEVLEKDLRVDTYRAGGAGGQKVNKTDSAVRLTHIPSGIVVQCQNERSQHQNRAVAMKVLKARLYEMEMEKKKAEARVLEDTKKDIAWGSQIRSYVLHPYRLIKDHRTDFEMGDVQAVLDGKLQPFIEAYLMEK